MTCGLSVCVCCQSGEEEDADDDMVTQRDLLRSLLNNNSHPEAAGK